MHAVSSDRESLGELKHSRSEHSVLILVQGSSASQCTSCSTNYLLYNNACYSQAFGLVVFVGAQELLALSVESTGLVDCKLEFDPCIGLMNRPRDAPLAHTKARQPRAERGPWFGLLGRRSSWRSLLDGRQVTSFPVSCRFSRRTVLSSSFPLLSVCFSSWGVSFMIFTVGVLTCFPKMRNHPRHAGNNRINASSDALAV